MIRRLYQCALVSSLFIHTAGCAEERDPINRVQANALDKEFFVGDLADPADDPVFFSRNFVVDASQSQELVGISQASGLERIRWHITENMLFARRAYAVVDGANRGTSVEPNGDVLAAYRIDSHFDIRNAYNPSTGEELNVVEEISSDRPWHERRFFRVDWSENLVNSPAWTSMFYGQVFGDIKLTPVAYFESDPSNDDAPHFDAEDGYFDVTSHFLVEPLNLDFGRWQVPMCLLMGMFTGSAIYSCDPQEAVVRASYWRVDKADPDDDFEPFENSKAALDVFGNPGGIGSSGSLGIITPPREHYEEAYGYIDDGLRRYMNIHDIWQQSHQTVGSCESDADCAKGATCLDSGTCSVPCNYDARRDGDENGTDDQCENSDTKYDGSEGSQCSPRNRCTIPYRDREVAPVAYYVNPEMPDELQSPGEGEPGASEALIETWNQALQHSVARAREVECRRTGGNRNDCHGKFFETESGRDKIQMIKYGGWGTATPKDAADVLVMCHNPVRDYDPDVCGEEGLRARVGDVRKNFIIYWPYNTEAPYGGIGNWRGDPLTGQILGAAATTVGRSATVGAGRARDIALVGLGELDLSDIVNGVSAVRYQQALRTGRTSMGLTQEQIDQRLESLDFEHLAEQAQFDFSGMQADNPKHAYLQLRSELTADPAMGSNELLRLEALAKPLIGSEFEAQMVNGNWLVDAMGMNPNTSITEAILDVASPLRGYDMGKLTQLDKQLFSELGLRGICHVNPNAALGSPDLYGVGQFYRQKYPSASSAELGKLIYEDMWKETYKGIQLHELGHSLGLLHNFTSSYDAQNYNPQYWQLRTHEGTSTTSCEGQPRTGNVTSADRDTCMGPRYLDPETDDELGIASEPRPGIFYFGHTSTMEYQNTRFFETVGLGQYDLMAMGALYGRVLETYDASSIPQTTQANYERFSATQLSEDITTTGFDGLHYTELARQLTLFDPARCRNASKEEKETAEWRIVHGKVCMPPPKDYGHWDDFVDTADPTLSLRQDLRVRKGRILGGKNVPASGNVRWPYRFGGDMMNAYLHVNPFDSGADPYEVTVETIRKNEYNYPFVYFRSHRRQWTDWNLPSYTGRMFYERLRSYHWGISYTNAFYNDITNEVPAWGEFFDELRQDDNELRPYLLAEAEMFHAIAANFLVPEPGSYGAAPQDDMGVFDLQAIGENGTLFELDASNGRYLSPSFDSSPNGGGSWMYQDYVNRAGYSVEKMLASRALTDGRAVFFSTGRDIYLDRRGLNINFRSDFPSGVDRLLGGVLAEDWQTVSPYISSSGTPELVSRDITSESPADLPQDTREIFPNLGYNQQVPTIIYAYLFGRANGDLTLSNKLRIWVDGSISGEFELPDAEQVRFTDPDSGITYIARKYGPESLYGREVDKGIGSRMLMRANTLLAEAYEVERDDDGNIVMDEFGRPTLALDESGARIETEDDGAPTRFRRYVGLLDADVQISTLLGYGPANWR